MLSVKNALEEKTKTSCHVWTIKVDVQFKGRNIICEKYRRKHSFFHLRGNSLRRVHVFLRLLEKTYHPFFEPEMGVLTLFCKKRPKRPKKFSNRGKKKKISQVFIYQNKWKNFFSQFLDVSGQNTAKKIFHSGKKKNFPIPGREISFAGMGKYFFFPLFEIFLFFLPFFENIVLAFLTFLAFFGLY